MEEQNNILHEVHDELIDDIAELVAEDQKGMVLNLFIDLHPVDQAMVLTRLDEDEAQKVFAWLPSTMQVEVLPELEAPVRALLLEDFKPAEIADLVDEMDSDDAADVISELPEELAQSVLPELEDEAELRELLSYEDDSAGGLMATELVSVPHTATVAEATEEVRRLAEEVEPIYAVYVVNEENVLIGIVSLKQLLLTPAKTPILSILKEDFIAVNPSADQEQAARIMEKYDLTVLPVVDTDGKLMGRITIDDIVDVIREEAEEDFQRMSGISSGDEELSDSILEVSKGRLPWLFIGLTGAMVSALVINGFQHELQKAIVLSMFIPVVASTAGNVGVQSSAIAVQGLATGTLWKSDMWRVVLKELMVSFLNATALSLGISLCILILSGFHVLALDVTHLIRLCATVALTMIVVIAIAASVGSLVPILLYRRKIDPAIATGPFVTTSNDILGLLIYFLIAKWIYFQ